MTEVLFISIKPEFTNKIFDGIKTIELRKSAPRVDKNTLVIIYSTIPVKAVIGISKVEEVIKIPPDELWAQYSDQLGIDRERFQEYYQKSDLAVGIRLASVSKLSEKISLDLIKEIYPSFNPPQTFKYFRKREVLKGYKKTLNSKAV